MYFSSITPAHGREREAAIEWSRGGYQDHQWLWRLFPAPPGSAREFLYRRFEKDGMPQFYVLSGRRPEGNESSWTVNSRAFTPQLTKGDRLRFDLRANPVVTRSVNGKKSRHDVVMERKRALLAGRGLTRWQDWQSDDRPALYSVVRDACVEWIRSRESGFGFAIDEPTLNVDSYQQHAEKGGRLRFSTVDFSGDLTVTEPVSFGVSLRNGVGHAKAFGCGLMLIKRPESQ